MGGRGVQRTNDGGGSSSGEEDGDADWRSAIDSVAAAATVGRTTDGLASTFTASITEYGEVSHRKHQAIKHYQMKAQKLLDDILEETIEIVRDPIHVPNDDPMINDGGVRLFKQAPPGIVFDHIDELQGPAEKPRILPGKEIDENSKKFRRKIQSVVVEGRDIMAAARDAHQKSLAKLEAKEAAARREEERVAELKKIKGERWLPSIARDMGLKFQGH